MVKKVYMSERLNKYSSKVATTDVELFFCNVHKVYFKDFCAECGLK